MQTPDNFTEPPKPTATTAKLPEAGKALPPIKIETLELDGEYEAARAEAPFVAPSGGDLHSAIPLDDGSGDIAVVMGDVSGHGPEQTAQAQGLQRSIVKHLEQGESPAETLNSVNAEVEPDPDFKGFATVFVGRLKSNTGQLTYASAGHEPGLVAPGDAVAPADIQELNTTGPPVGVAAAMAVNYNDEEAHVPKGGTLFLYTDGISQARSPKQRHAWLGVDRLKEMLARYVALRPRNLISRIFGRVLAFSNVRLSDDAALMAVRRSKNGDAVIPSGPAEAHVPEPSAESKNAR